MEAFPKTKFTFILEKKTDSATWVSVDLMHKSLLKIQTLITNQRFLLDPVPPLHKKIMFFLHKTTARFKKQTIAHLYITTQKSDQTSKTRNPMMREK